MALLNITIFPSSGFTMFIFFQSREHAHTHACGRMKLAESYRRSTSKGKIVAHLP